MPDPARMLQSCVLGKQSLFVANGNARQEVVEYVVDGWEELLAMSEAGCVYACAQAAGVGP